MRRARHTSIEELIRDERRGSLEIFEEALNILLTSEEACREALLLARAHPEMSALQYLAEAACRGKLRKLREFYDNSKVVLARTCVEHLSDLGVRVVATISRSSAVINCIKELAPSEVLVGESLPGGEGIETAKLLSGMGIKVIIVSDSLLPWVAKRRGAVGLVGADRVTRTHLINKAGTFALACSIDTIAVPGLLKLQDEPYSIHESLREFEGISRFEAKYDETPLDKFKSLIFEGIVVDHREIGRVFEKLYDIIKN